MKKIVLLTALSAMFSVALVHAQATDVTPKGSPYLSDAYEEGVIYLSNANHKYPARYNAFTDLVEYQQNGRMLVLDPTTQIKKVQLNNTTFFVEKYIKQGKPKYGYFARLDSGKVILYSKKIIEYLPGRKGGALDGTDQAPEYLKRPDRFFIKVGNAGGLEEVTNLKSVIAAFPDKQDELAAYAKKEKISAKKGEELAQLVRYYNSMQ
jgi:hypothetical protein